MEDTALLIDQRSSVSTKESDVHERDLGPTNPIEGAKIALKRDFPWLEFMYHTAVLAIVGILLWIHIIGLFWRDFKIKNQKRQNMELQAFQVASKAHELLMLASLSMIVFHYMRRLLVGRNGIPFGLVNALHVTGSPSMLFKWSFWAGWRRHLPFGGLLFLTCIFSLTLGPSSAITVIPSLEWYEMKNAFPADGSTVLYNATAAKIWPTVFNNSMDTNQTARCLQDPFKSPLNLHCPSAGFIDIYKWFISFTKTGSRDDLLFTDLRASSVQRKVSIKTGNSPKGGWAYTTVITELSSRTLAETKYAKPNDTIFDRLPSKIARFKWYKSNNGNLSSSLLALAIIPVSAKNSTKDRYPSTATVACSTDARWVSSDAYYQPKNSTTVSSNVSDALSETEWKPEKALLTKLGISENPLDLRLDWAHFLNRQQSEWLADNSSSTVSGMARFLNTAIIRPKQEDNRITAFYAPNMTTPDTGGAFEEAIAMLVGTVLVDGIARSMSRLSSFVKTNATADVVTRLETFLPSGERLFKWNPDSYVPGFYSVRITLDSYGYGYGLQNTAVWAAMIVLLLFALMLIVHVAFVGYSVARGRYYGGECWEDVAELIALAMNSAPSEKLYGTSAGVERADTWRSMIKIQETGDQHLELCVVDGHQEDGETVKIGKKYL
ncbi:hypothetical protein J4E80_006779 [Alternaria sp. BMP 0032]|nr:hypothetical protein J4E80_006779 [Alternaria sp. BMP 0032]